LTVDTKVSVLVSSAEWQSLVHSRMQQILRKRSEYSKNRIHIKTGGVWQYGHGQQFEQFVGSFNKMCCTIGFQLDCIFPTDACKYCYKSQGLGVDCWDLQGLGLGLEFL